MKANPPFVEITRALTRQEIELNKLGRLYPFRFQKFWARQLAVEQMRTPFVHMRDVKIMAEAGGRIFAIRMTFEAVQQHRYRPVDRCLFCSKRWHEHRVWEKQP